jgi:hypothetical protein
MIEITTFGLMVIALIAGALIRDYWHARRDRQRAARMGALVEEFTGQSILNLVMRIGDPYERMDGTSGRSLYIWKAPPSERLPPGSGLLTVVATVEMDGAISEITWRDRT